jgi:predicted RNA binding protein YcfA (HicA-like mRNA interferase family)
MIAALRRAGFDLLRVRGSHHVLGHVDGRRTVVPVHAGETLGPGITKAILDDVEMTSEELENYL